MLWRKVENETDWKKLTNQARAEQKDKPEIILFSLDPQFEKQKQLQHPKISLSSLSCLRREGLTWPQSSVEVCYESVTHFVWDHFSACVRFYPTDLYAE